MDFAREIKRFHTAAPPKTQTVSGIAFPYRLLGSGEKTLVFLPGFLASSEGYCRHLLALAKDFRVLSFDYPAGFSTNEALCDGIAALMDRLNINKAVFAGQSFGGFLAQIMAVRHPDKTEALVLSNTGTLYESMNDAAKEELTVMSSRFLKLRLQLLLIPSAFYRAYVIKKAMAATRGMTKEERAYYKQLFAYVYGRMTKKTLRRMLALAAGLKNSTPMRLSDFEYLSGRVLLIMAPDDHTFGDSTLRGLVDMMSAPRIFGEIKGGHLAPLFSAETYVRLVRQFMQTL